MRGFSPRRATISSYFFQYSKRPDPIRPVVPNWPRKMTVFACVGRQKCDFLKWWWKSTDSCCEKAEKTANFYAAWSIIHVRSVSHVRHPHPFNFMSTFQSYTEQKWGGNEIKTYLVRMEQEKPRTEGKSICVSCTASIAINTYWWNRCNTT